MKINKDTGTDLKVRHKKYGGEHTLLHKEAMQMLYTPSQLFCRISRSGCEGVGERKPDS